MNGIEMKEDERSIHRSDGIHETPIPFNNGLKLNSALLYVGVSFSVHHTHTHTKYTDGVAMRLPENNHFVNVGAQLKLSSTSGQFQLCYGNLRFGRKQKF